MIGGGARHTPQHGSSVTMPITRKVKGSERKEQRSDMLVLRKAAVNTSSACFVLEYGKPLRCIHVQILNQGSTGALWI